jgi:Leucine-rich repeat (LRR) protein
MKRHLGDDIGVVVAATGDCTNTTPFALPELLSTILERAVVRCVFHTYAGLLCVSRGFYATMSEMLWRHFKRTDRLRYQMLSNRSLVYHYKSRKLDLAEYRVNKPAVDNAVLGQMTQLTTLNLANNELIMPSTVRKLTRLTNLNLDGNTRIHEDTLGALPGLTTLHLRSNRIIGGECLVALSGLTHLSLCHNIYLSHSRYMTQLTHITSLGLVADKHLSSAVLGQMTQLTKLVLSHNVTIEDGALLRLTRLESLELDGQTLIGSQALARMTSLRKLALCSNSDIGDEALLSLTRLETLMLSYGSVVTDRGLSLLSNLTYLSVAGTPGITPASLPYLPKLKGFALRYNVNHFGLHHLTHLDRLVLNYGTGDHVMKKEIEEFAALREDKKDYNFVHWDHDKCQFQWERY